ncbi:hypothetical protein [Bacillus timonensis]|uniref:hypothetical protein n=1 Tax=Bacillus timonensis TaxID=1033734 RepID=UPI000288D9BE|nr:hypothetical protein [Bacillus timonensis]
MKKFFRNPDKVTLTSLIATVIVVALLFVLLNFAVTDSIIIHTIGKIAFAVFLPFLIVNPVFGLIYSFFVKGKIKILYILLHLACICTVSLFAFTAFMFRYFVPFAP